MAMDRHVSTVGHVHDCKLTRFTDRPKLKLFDRVSAFFRRHMTVSRTYARSTLFFRSKASIKNEIRRHTGSSTFYIIHPMSHVRLAWEVILWFNMHAFLAIMPLDVLTLSLNCSTSSEQLLLLVLLMELVFAWDILFSFFTGYVDRETREVVLDRKKIFKRYCSTYLIVDLVCTVPHLYRGYVVSVQHTSQVELSAGDPMYVYYYMVVFTCLLRVGTVLRFKNYLERLLEAIRVDYFHYRIACTFISSAIVFHWSAVFALVAPFVAEHISAGAAKNTWLFRAGFNVTETSTQVLYMHGLYYVTSIILSLPESTTTYVASSADKTAPTYSSHRGDRSTENRATGLCDYFITLVLSIVSIFYLGLLFVEILCAVRAKSGSAMKYYSFMTQLREYMRHVQLPKFHQQKLVSFFENRYKHAYFKEEAIMSTLSDSLRNQIVYSSRQQLIRHIFDEISYDILHKVVKNLTTQVYLPKDLICKAGTVGNCMYFIVSGTVAVYTPSGKEVCHLQDGDYFGEICLLLKDHKRIASVVAVEFCEMYLLDRPKFASTVVQVSAVYERLLTLAKLRIRQTRGLEALNRKIYQEELDPFDEDLELMLD